jgi:RND family efflux transporter MFP subunit
MTCRSPLIQAVILFILLLAVPALAHEGHDHADQPKSSAQIGTTPRLEATSGPFELVAVMRNGELVIYLDRFQTNEPVTGAKISVETPKGSQDAKESGGTYRLDASWAKDASVDLIFTVMDGATTEVLTGTLIQPGARDGARQGWSLFSPAFAQGLKDKITSGGVWIVALITFVLGFVIARFTGRSSRILTLTILLSLSAIAPNFALAHEGEDHSDPKTPVALISDTSQRLADGSLLVPKPIQRILAIRTRMTETSTHKKVLELPGRIIPDPNASGFVQASVSGRLSAPSGGFPKLGTVVKAGDLLAFVTPPFQAIDVSDMRQKAGELDQQISIVEKRVARFEPLVQKGAVARVSLDEAMMELKGLKERRVALDRTRGESEKLIAPVSGVIGASNAVAGQIAESNAVVFQIVDPERLWVEALTFNLLPDAGAATARTSEGAKLALKFQGAGLTDRSQAIPVHFAVEGAPKGLRVGQLVTVMAVTGEEVKGLAVPRTSVLRSANGQTIVFEHAAAERFEPRLVRVEPLDAENVLVLDGLTEGKRVVVQGAELLNQIR